MKKRGEPPFYICVSYKVVLYENVTSLWFMRKKKKSSYDIILDLNGTIQRCCNQTTVYKLFNWFSCRYLFSQSKILNKIPSWWFNLVESKLIRRSLDWIEDLLFAGLFVAYVGTIGFCFHLHVFGALSTLTHKIFLQTIRPGESFGKYNIYSIIILILNLGISFFFFLLCSGSKNNNNITENVFKSFTWVGQCWVCTYRAMIPGLTT